MPMNPSQTCTTSTAAEKENPRFAVRHVIDGMEYPSLGLSVYIEGPPEDCYGFPRWLGRASCSRTTDINLADIVIFSGGSDVNPTLYGEQRLEGTYVDEKRDEDCIRLYQQCVDRGIPMLGVCRGAQFLWVMKGGKLWQDVDGHNYGQHRVTLLETNQQLIASSVHHQACRFGVSGSRLLMSAASSTKRVGADVTQTGPMTDIEAYTFEKDAILGFQGHPEYDGFPTYSKLCLDLIERYICLSSRTRLVNGVYRLVD